LREGRVTSRSQFENAIAIALCSRVVKDVIHEAWGRVRAGTMMQPPSRSRSAAVALWLLACSGRVQKDAGVAGGPSNVGAAGVSTGGSANAGGGGGGAAGNTGGAEQSAGGHALSQAGAQNPDVRTQLCERLDRCFARHGMTSVAQCRDALASDDDTVLQRCANCFLRITEDCPPDDACEGSCPPHGF
jgi:hypothetical protein